MATRTATITNPNVHLLGDNSFRMATWTTLANGDDGSPVELPSFPDRTLQVTGTFGTGGTIVFEGSNDGTNYVTLRDVLGSDISLTAAGVKSVLDLPRYVRPRVTAGDGTTNLTAVLLLRRQDTDR